MSPTLYRLSYPARLLSWIFTIALNRSLRSGSGHELFANMAKRCLWLCHELERTLFANSSWLRGWDSNPQSQGYEPCEMPFLYPASSRLVLLPRPSYGRCSIQIAPLKFKSENQCLNYALNLCNKTKTGFARLGPAARRGGGVLFSPPHN